MIEPATERRLAGDLVGACAAAKVDLDVDFAAVRSTCGRETADLVADDLHHIVPDLLRWNMPRVLATAEQVHCHGLSDVLSNIAWGAEKHHEHGQGRELVSELGKEDLDDGIEVGQLADVFNGLVIDG